jgi:hypothetical protein
MAFLRVAQWSPDSPAVDVCVTAAGDTFAGQMPQIAQLAAGGDAGTADGGPVGLSFPQVTSYLIVPPGAYSVRLVAAGAADCSTGLVDLATATFADGTYTTIAALGDRSPVASDQPLQLVAFVDDVTAPAGQIALRFINASPSSSLASIDLGTGSLAGTGGAYAPLFTGVEFAQSSAAAGSDAGAVDANGYLASNPLAGATLSAHVTTTALDTAVAPNNVTVMAPSAATIALVGGGASPAKLLQCTDADDSSGTSLLTTCTVISQ